MGVQAYARHHSFLMLALAYNIHVSNSMFKSYHNQALQRSTGR
jgi:hypothetical protein